MSDFSNAPQPTSLNVVYFDEMEVEMSWTSARRTITEADLTNFAGVSGDFNPLHVDAVASSQGPFQQRLVHGILVLAIATGLRQQMGIFAGSLKAMAEMREWKFLKPVFINDTIVSVTTVVEMRETKRPGQGIVIQRVDVVNQEGETVQTGEFVSLMINQPVPEG